MAQIILLILAAMTPDDSFVVGAWYQSWSVFRETSGNRKPFSLELIEPNLVTDLYFAFAVFGYATADINPEKSGLTGDFLLRPLYKTDQNVLQLLKDKGNIKLWLSVGGDHFNNPNDPWKMGAYTHKLFSKMVAKKENRKAFIQSAISYAHAHGFDGIDIDWEYPGDQTRGGSERDFENFPIFLQECRTAFHAATPPLQISLALPPTLPAGIAKKYHEEPKLYYQWLAKLVHLVDRAAIMAYNYHTPFDGSLRTGVNAPLLRDTLQNSTLYIAKSLEMYLQNGAPKNKLCLGIPLYGWLFSSVKGLKEGKTGPGLPFELDGKERMLPYFMIADKKWKVDIDRQTGSSYAYNLFEKQWISFDVPETTKLKVDLAKKNGLLGVVFWSIDQDEYQRQPRFPNIKQAHTQGVW